VGLIDRQEADVPALQVGEETGKHQSLRSGIKKPILPIMEAAQAPRRFARGKRGIQKGGGDAAGLQSIDLVLHQGNERRDDDRKPGPDHGGQLKTERFAATRGKQRQDILSIQGIANDLFLQRAKGSETEVLFKYGQQIWHAGLHAVN
jgi:hypothetical protein